MADLETPVSAFLRAAWPERECFLLESVEGGEQVGRYTFIGLAPFKRIVARGRQIAITEGLGNKRPKRFASRETFSRSCVRLLAGTSRPAWRACLLSPPAP